MNFASLSELLSQKPDQTLRFGLSRIVSGQEPLVLANLIRSLKDIQDGNLDIIHICRDDKRLAALKDALAFFADDLKVFNFPAWDCVPYDRAGPRSEIIAERIATLTQLEKGKRHGPRLVLTTPRAILQKIPPRNYIRTHIKVLSPGQRIDRTRLLKRLEAMGYIRSEMVIDRGEFAVRGSIIDLFLSGYKDPVRLDFFGDDLETIRQFDTATQRTKSRINRLTILPISEVDLSDEARALFRKRYLEQFGTAKSDDLLYEAISSGQNFQGMEHWLSYFHESLDTLFDYLPNALLSFEDGIEPAIQSAHEQIDEHYDARCQALEQETFGTTPYNPAPINDMFLNQQNWGEVSKSRSQFYFTPFDFDKEAGFDEVLSVGGRAGINFSIERRDESAALFASVVKRIIAFQDKKKRIIIAAWTSGSCERLQGLLKEAGLDGAIKVNSWQEAIDLPPSQIAFIVLGLEAGFETDNFLIISEQDILGDRLIRRKKRRSSDAEILRDAASLSIGDLIVHNDHGIGKFEGLKTIDAAGTQHDCLELIYHGGDKLFLPVENIELLTRYGSEESSIQLDRLGGQAWQARRAKLKKKLFDIAEQLVEIAAKRTLRKAPALSVPTDHLNDFVSRFPFEETEDQKDSIDAVSDDLASGRPMDRLVCGDVGFGKTEVALRASFIAAMAGKQVALVAPTTLLARQHYKSFQERFEGFPIKIGHASRLVGTKGINEVKKGLADGQIDIVIGTHALLGKSVHFHDLGLLIIDEEQHFGVQHKERLKELKSNVHVLTLSATPIPRTLQMSLTGVRDLSLITTPPVDRLAVRTYVSPFDPVVIRNALLRERFRGGQSFFVCPRISDLDEAAQLLREHVPELKFIQAHGRMPPSELDDVMNAFYERKFDCLLSTTIIESGLDIPTANTMIIYRADKFGLAQLYQLRGRVGRSKKRAYAYFTTPIDKQLTDQAAKRLKILASLDTLGAGFTLAAHDLDMRGAGNIVGEEQSGHIKEVGFELYQSMLDDAIASLKEGGNFDNDDWSPVIQIGTSVLIPETYVKDLQLRLSLYRRASSLTNREEIDEFKTELIDRFGPLPEEVLHLMDIMYIKILCRAANVDSIDAGPKGAQIGFYQDRFDNPEGLIAYAADNPKRVKLQANHKLSYKGDWQDPEERLQGVISLINQLKEIAKVQTAANG